jgi:hypothetical protein
MKIDSARAKKGAATNSSGGGAKEVKHLLRARILLRARP